MIVAIVNRDSIVKNYRARYSSARVPLKARNSMTSKLNRKQLREALETVPITEILGKSVSRELTPKQKRFAHEVAKGKTKADAYRTAYKPTATKRTLAAKPYELARDERVKREIEAYQMAIEAAKYRTPAALRELVIQSLVEVVINPEAKESVRVQAAKVLGTVTEVAAFTERKEVRTVSSSADAKAQVMAQIRELMKAQAQDANIIEADASSLLDELAAAGAKPAADPGASGGTSAETGQAEPHPSPAPQASQEEAHPLMHTIPHKPPQSEPNPQPLSQEDGSVTTQKM